MYFSGGEPLGSIPNNFLPSTTKCAKSYTPNFELDIFYTLKKYFLFVRKKM